MRRPDGGNRSLRDRRTDGRAAPASNGIAARVLLSEGSGRIAEIVAAGGPSSHRGAPPGFHIGDVAVLRPSVPALRETVAMEAMETDRGRVRSTRLAWPAAIAG